MKHKKAVPGEKWKTSGSKVRRKHPAAVQFAVAFVLSLCLLGLLLSFFLIECHIRQTVYGKVELPVSFRLNEGLPVITRQPQGEPVAQMSLRGQQAAWALLPSGQRLTAALIRGETALITEAWAWVTWQIQRIKDGDVHWDLSLPPAGY